MAISKRIQEAMEKMAIADFESALIPASIAVDATAQQEYRGLKNNEAYKLFIHDRMVLITKFSLGGGGIENMNFGYSHPDLKPDENGFVSLQQILYHVVRCGLLHGAKLPGNLQFWERRSFKGENGAFWMPGPLVYGLIAAVVVAPTNSAERVPEHWGFQNASGIRPINDFSGNEAELRKFMDAGRASDS